MSAKFDEELAKTFGIGERLAAANAALRAKKWEPNEEGETATISKALNPPSLGPRAATSVATRRKRDWSWVYKMLKRVALGLLVLLVLYRLYKAVKRRACSLSKNTKPQGTPTFGAAGRVSREQWVDHLREVAARIRGDQSVMRVAIDVVRADVLLGLATSTKVTVSGSEYEVPPKAVDAALDAYNRTRSEPSAQDELEEPRSRVNSAVRALAGALPPTALRETLEYMMEREGAFELSHVNVPRPADVARVLAVHNLRQSLVAPSAPQFGKPQKCCLFVSAEATPCTGKCKTKRLCEKHQRELSGGNDGKSDLELLEAHLSTALVSDPVAKKVRDKAVEIMSMRAWTDESTHDQVVAAIVNGGPQFGLTSDALLAGAKALKSAVTKTAEAGYTVVSAAATGAASVGSALMGYDSPPADSSATSGSTESIAKPAAEISAASESTPAAESNASAESIASASTGASEARKAPGTGWAKWRSISRERTRKQNKESQKYLSKEEKSYILDRQKEATEKRQTAAIAAAFESGKASAKERARSTPASSTAESTDTSSAPVAVAADAKRAATRTQSERKGREVSPERLQADARRRERSAERKQRRGASFLSGGEFLERALTFVGENEKQNVRDQFAARAAQRAQLLEKLKSPKAPFVEQLAFFLDNVPLSAKHRAEQSAIAEYWAGKVVALEDKMFARYAMIRRNVETVRRDLLSVTIPLTVTQARECVERDASAIKRVVAAEKHEEIDERAAHVVLAIHSPPVPGPDNAADPILATHAALLDRAKALVEEQRLTWADWSKRELTPWITRRVIYDTAVPTCTPSAPIKDMILVGYYGFVKSVKDILKMPSVADTVTNSSPGFGLLPGGPSLETIKNSALGKKAMSALGGGGGGVVDTVLGVVKKGGDITVLVSAIVAAARVGEALIMQLLAFVVEGLKLLVKAFLGHRHTVSDSIQRTLDGVTQSPEGRDEQQKRDVEALRNQVSRLTKVKGTLEDILESSPKTSFGADAALTTPLSGAEVAMSYSNTFHTAKTGGDSQSKAKGSTAEAASALLDGAKKAPGAIFGGIQETISEVWKKGDVLDLFGALTTKIQEAMFGSLAAAEGRSWKGAVATFLTVAFVEYDQYSVRVNDWLQSRASLRGLLTDPASVLPGDANQRYRDVLREHGSLAVYAVMFLFGLRVAQIVQKLFASSPLYGIVCDLLQKVRSEIEKVAVVGKLLGPVVGAIASVSGCPEAGALDEKEDLQQQIEGLEEDIQSIVENVKKQKTQNASPTAGTPPVTPTLAAPVEGSDLSLPVALNVVDAGQAPQLTEQQI